MIGMRVRSARVLGGMTQQDVVDALAGLGVIITTAAISKYELGKSVPPATLLLTLATVLSVEPGYFLHEPTATVQWHRFRKHAALGKRDQQRIMLFSEAVVEQHLRLREDLGVSYPPDLPPRISVKNEREAESAARKTREAWSLGDHPIERMTGLMEDRGCIVVETPRRDGEFHGLSGTVDDEIPLIVVSSRHSLDRKRSNLAHELAHLVMDCSGLTEKEEESCAKRFAGAFIAPENVVIRELGSKRLRIQMPELALLKKRYGLSMQAWARRAFDLDVITAAQYTTLCKRFSARGWRLEEPVTYEGFEEPIRLKQMAFRALAEGLISKTQLKDICPGCETDLEEGNIEVTHGFKPSDILMMPEDERRSLLMEAAERAAPYYEEDDDLYDFDALLDEDPPDAHNQG